VTSCGSSPRRSFDVPAPSLDARGGDDAAESIERGVAVFQEYIKRSSGTNRAGRPLDVTPEVRSGLGA
jgi:hypothetical protein